MVDTSPDSRYNWNTQGNSPTYVRVEGWNLPGLALHLFLIVKGYTKWQRLSIAPRNADLVLTLKSGGFSPSGEPAHLEGGSLASSAREMDHSVSSFSTHILALSSIIRKLADRSQALAAPSSISTFLTSSAPAPPAWGQHFDVLGLHLFGPCQFSPPGVNVWAWGDADLG